MHRVTGEVNCADERCVDVAEAECSRRDPERVKPAVFLTADGEARTGHVVLTVQPVGNQVRHRAEHAGSSKRWANEIARFSQRLRCAVMLSSKPPAGSEPGGFGVGAHPDVDAGGGGWQRCGVSQCLVGDLQHRELLAECCLQIVWWELLSGELEFDVGQSPDAICVEARGVTQQSVAESWQSDRASCCDANADDGNRHGLHRVVRLRRLRTIGHELCCSCRLFEDEVRVVATEPEGRDACPEHAVSNIAPGPGLGCTEHTEWRVAERS